MRTIQEAIDQSRSLANTHPNIRALIYQGSLVLPSAKIDAFTDIDPLFLVDDLDAFLNDETWIDAFGSPIARFNDTIMTKNGGTWHTRLMIMDDHFKIDASFMHARDVTYVRDLPLYKIIIDKDGIVPEPKHTDASPFYVTRPTSDAFSSLLQTCFFDVSYVAKSLRRGEYFFTRRMFSVLNEKLTRLLGWYVGIHHDFCVNIGAEGRYLFDVLDEPTRAMVEDTFAGADPDDQWRAVHAYIRLVGHAGRAVAGHLGYVYPEQTHRDMTTYLNEAAKRTLTTDTTFHF